MAKVGAMQRGWKGKTAGIVYAKGETGTIARELVTPKNPRTRLQMSQRIIFATVMQAAKILKPLINHSFEGVAYGNKSVREFTSRNIARLRQFAALDFEETPSAVDARAFMTTKGVQALVPNMYRVSNGSLPAPAFTVSLKSPSNPAMNTDRLNFVPVLSAGRSKTFELYGVNGTAKGVKLGDILNWVFGMSTVGQQISLVVIHGDRNQNAYVYGNDAEAPGFVIRNTQMSVFRAVLADTVNLDEIIQVSTAEGTEVMESAIENVINAVSAAFLASDKSSADLISWFDSMLQDAFSFTSPITAQSTTINAQFEPEDNANFDLVDFITGVAGASHVPYAAGVIASRQVAGSWRRSTCDLVLQPITDNNNINYGLTWNLAVDAWFAGQVLADTTEYLNEGGDVNVLS